MTHCTKDGDELIQCPRCGHDDEWIGRMCDFCGTCRICGKFSAEVSGASNLPPCRCAHDAEPINQESLCDES